MPDMHGLPATHLLSKYESNNDKVGIEEVQGGLAASKHSRNTLQAGRQGRAVAVVASGEGEVGL